MRIRENFIWFFSSVVLLAQERFPATPSRLPRQCMELLARGLAGAANAGVFALVTRLAGPTPVHTCVCSFEAPSTDEKVLAVLQSQLDRCGPERLNIPSCPTCDCNCVYPPESGYSFAAVLVLCISCAFFGFIAGVAWSRQPRHPALTSPASQEVVNGTPAQTVPRPPGPQTPASLRALRE